MSPNPVGDRFERLAQSIAERVVNLVLDAIDINALIDRVDINALVDKVDMDEMVDKLDVEAIIDRVDVNAIISRVDIDSLVEKTELGSIIAKSTTGVLTEVLDLVRSQGVGLDDFFARWTNRILHRKPGSLPIGPALLVTPAAPPALGAGPPGLERT
jgi:hypothetical protein